MEADFNNRYAGDTSAQAETHRTITDLWTVKVAGPAARWFSVSVKKIGGVPPTPTTPTGAPTEAGAHGEYAVPENRASATMMVRFLHPPPMKAA